MLRLLALAVIVTLATSTPDTAAPNLALYNHMNTSLCGFQNNKLGPLPAKYFVKNERSPPVCILLRIPDFNKIVFYPTVDQFTLMDVVGSWSDSKLMRYGDMEFRLEIGNIFSPWQRVFSEDYQYVIPFVTGIVTLDNGSPVSIAWDNACLGCSGTQCISGTSCGIQFNTTDGADGTCAGRAGATGTTDCDLKVYLGWYGTDGDNTYLTSSGQRYSAFRQYSAYSAYSTAADTLNQEKPQFPTQLPDDFTGGTNTP